MTLIFYMLVLIACMVVKTAVFPFVPMFRAFYNPAVLFVLWLGLYRPVKESLAVVFVLGFFMDSLSASPFGLNIIIYFWLYMGVMWLNQFFHGDNFVLLAVLAAAGVLLENLASFTAVAANAGVSVLHAKIVENLGAQLMWALVTGPVLIRGFSRLHAFMANRAADKTEANGKAGT